MKKIGIKINIFILESLAWLVGIFLAKIPHRAFVAIVRALGRIFHTFDKRRAKDALSNLDFVFAQKYTQEQKQQIIRRAYDNFAFVLLETIRWIYIPREKFLSKFDFENEHFLADSIAQDGSAVVVSAHFGYWEALTSAIAPRYDMCEVASLGRLTQFESINYMIIKRREATNVKMIDKKGAFKHLLKMYARKRALVGILVDQNIALSEGVEVQFFGKRATHTTIASVLSRRFNCAIVPIFIDFNDDYSRYKARYFAPIRAANSENLDSDILAATQEQANATQKAIEQNPSSWFWFHKRFKSFYPEIYSSDYKKGAK